MLIWVDVLTWADVLIWVDVLTWADVLAWKVVLTWKPFDDLWHKQIIPVRNKILPENSLHNDKVGGRAGEAFKEGLRLN